MRRRPWLHALSVVTLAAAFLSFTATLTAAFNLDSILSRWVGSAQLTVYLAEGLGAADLDRLAEAVTAVEGVERVEKVAPAEARDRFARDLGSFGDMAQSLPESAFPASIDIHLGQALARNERARRELAGRLAKVELVGEVDVYDDWFDRLWAVSLMGRLAAWGLGLLAFVVALLVVAATVRAGVAARRKEIEVLRLVGATDGYVRLPFLIQGGLEAAVAMVVAVTALHLLMGRVELVAGELLPLIGGGGIVRLTAGTTVTLVLGGILAGLAGARVSLRRLEEA
jgi:cell division transport system permease protein